MTMGKRGEHAHRCSKLVLFIISPGEAVGRIFGKTSRGNSKKKRKKIMPIRLKQLV